MTDSEDEAGDLSVPVESKREIFSSSEEEEEDLENLLKVAQRIRKDRHASLKQACGGQSKWRSGRRKGVRFCNGEAECPVGALPCCAGPEPGSCRLLQEILPESANSLEKESEWEELEMAVDSGASASVVPEDALKSVQTTEGRAGVMYEIADGTRMPNWGEKRFRAHTAGGIVKRMRVDVAEVNKALLSVSKIVQAGSTVVFSPKESYIKDSSGGKIPLVERHGMYMLSLWVKKGDQPLSPF